MSNPIVVVTGAAGVLGAAVVRRFLADGARVVAVDRAWPETAGIDADAYLDSADLTVPEEVDALFARIVEAHGVPEVVVHPVGAYRPGGITESTPADYRLLMQVNLDAAWWVSRAAAVHMPAAGGGALIHVGARNGIEPRKGAAAYGVSKAALVHLARVLDIELRPVGVRVNVIVPSVIDTPTNRATLGPAAMAHAVSADAIAAVIAFLASPAAAPVSGAVIPVTG